MTRNARRRKPRPRRWPISPPVCGGRPGREAAGPVSTRIVADKVRGLKGQGLSREEALALLLDEIPPGYPDEVALDRERLTRLVDKWWDQADKSWESMREQSEKERKERWEKEKRELSHIRLTPYAEVAVAFASALVDKDFARAESLLTPDSVGN